MESISNKKKVSKLAIVSLVFIIIGLLVLPVCRQTGTLLEMGGHNPTRFQTYIISIIPWFIAMLLNLLALVLIKIRPSKQKGIILPSSFLVISLSSIVFFSIPRSQMENTVVVDKNKTFEGDSSELRSTLILPALDSPVIKNQNVIWCSSFQLAWNELKKDIIKEPIVLSEKQEFANLLNQAGQSKQDIMECEYYARAGFIGDGIVETIQREMKQKFPDEPVRAFEDVTSETAIISYSFLSANVRFKIPYFENEKEMVFTDSAGNRTPIASFGLRQEDDYAYYRLRRQIYILFSNRNSKFELTECAIDLCSDSSPNQIVLAMVEPKATLMETLSYIEEQHKKAPEDDYCHEFGPNDVLLVPNIFWEITHSFNELEGNTIQNSKYKGLPIEKAMQVVKFRLDRSGAVLKSESKLYCTPVPTFYVFDRPFLVYMKKRGADYPFFAMWIDNADLLEKYKSYEQSQSKDK